MRPLLLLFLMGMLVSCNEEYVSVDNSTNPQRTAKENLGKKLFFEVKLSNPEGQACASCHNPETGFSDPNHSIVSQGILANSFGNRNAPSLAYGVFSPERYYNAVDETYVGGMFLDGRSQNLETQILGPLMNAVEMNNTSHTMIANKIRNLEYFNDFTAIYGSTNDDNELLSQFANAVATYEKSREVNSFTSKFDYYSKGTVEFTQDEKDGLAIFTGKAQCANCHIVDADENTGKVLFTDFTYDNIGVPKNPLNPYYNMPASINPNGTSYVDKGIGAIVNQNNHNGKFKVPSLRNVAISAPYFHNGVYNTLEEVIHFYNKRDVENLGAPEFASNVNQEELGNLQLSLEEERKLKVFLGTLTDHYRK